MRWGSIYIHNAAKGANLKIFPPTYARGKMRVGFMCIRSVKVGEELFWDYGYR